MVLPEFSSEYNIFSEPSYDIGATFNQIFGSSVGGYFFAYAHNNVSIYSGNNNVLVENPNDRGSAGVRLVFILDSNSEYKLILSGGSNSSRIIPSIRIQKGRDNYVYESLFTYGSKVIHVGNIDRIEVLIYSEYGFTYEITGIELQEIKKNKYQKNNQSFLSTLNVTYSNNFPEVTVDQLMEDIGLTGTESFNEKVL